MSENKVSVPGSGASLNDWLDYISNLHDKPMDLGLERMKTMIARMGIEFDCPVITVGGTNGKGSTCAFIDGILRYSSYHVGLHTSPHLLRFNERCVIDGHEVDDEVLIEAFKEVEAARRDLTLTYFEYTGLAILRIFQKANLDAVILEVGLGGRLDAMNAIDSDCAVVCSIDIDHAKYLGSTREEIGLEKACIYRHFKPAICTDPNPPKSLTQKAYMLLAPLFVYGRDFRSYKHHGMWDFEMETHDQVGHQVDWRNLPMPATSGERQLQNAAGALAALATLNDRLEIQRTAVCEALTRVHILARYDMIKPEDETGASVTVDVGHNPQAAAVLADNLMNDAKPGQQTWAVFGMLSDKDMVAVSKTVNRHIDRWFVCPLPGVRGASVAQLTEAMKAGGVDMTKVQAFDSVDTAIHTALDDSRRCRPGTVRIIGFGSFVTVSGIMESLKHDKRVQEGGD
ncbi:MAG: Mur ligase family protein [Sutterellaceae bacterium]|nr:Mur ligase family protein [Sutterellaceae bacterium]